MQTFSNAVARVSAAATRLVLANLNFVAFVAGFGVFAVSLAAYSARLSGVVSGAIVMAIAAYPFVRKS